MVSMEEKESIIDAKLRRIRTRRRVFLCLIAGWLPWGLLVMNVTGASSFQVAAIGAYLLVAAVSGAIAGFSTCPRCESLFFLKAFSNAFFSSQCVHCGQRFPDEQGLIG